MEIPLFAIMQSVYASQHLQITPPDEQLREHVFGTNGNPGCDSCRRETEILVSHQQEFA